MNGLELSRKVRGDATLCHLPIIAVTSLASEEDIATGKQAGIDEYLIKLDRELLVESVARQLRLAAQAHGQQGRQSSAGTGSQS